MRTCILHKIAPAAIGGVAHNCGGVLGVQCGSGEHVVGLEGFYLRLGMIDEGFVVVVTLSVVNYQPASYLHATLIHPRILHASSSYTRTPIPYPVYSTQVHIVRACSIVPATVQLLFTAVSI